MQTDSPSSSISISLEQAQSIADTHLSTPEAPATVESLADLSGHNYPSIPGTKSYILTLSPPYPLTLLLLALPSPSTDDAFPPHSFPTLQTLHTLLTTSTSLPLPPLHTLSTSLTIIPYHYALFPAAALSDNNTTSLPAALGLSISPASRARIDLHLGSLLRQAHALQNDWFGPPTPTPSDPEQYTWQEAFTPRLECVIDRLALTHPHLASWDALRRALSRAIAFFLFDDAEVPCLAASLRADDIWVAFTDTRLEDPRIAFVHPASLLRVLWGDPLLESLLLPPGPSTALLEAYNGGEPLMVFPRQRTKRLWYLLFIAGCKLCDGDEGMEDVVKECAEKLEDAPCY